MHEPLEKTKVEIGNWHKKLLLIESFLTKRNILLFLVIFAFLSWSVVPSLVYSLELFDIHYLGWFNDPLPPLALTTQHKNYYSANRIPFRTIDTVKKNHSIAQYNYENDLPQKWHVERPHPYNRAYQWMRRRMLQGEQDKTETSSSLNNTNSTNLTLNFSDDVSTALEIKKFTASYPDPVLTNEQIKYWGFIIYLIGKCPT